MKKKPETSKTTEKEESAECREQSECLDTWVYLGTGLNEPKEGDLLIELLGNIVVGDARPARNQPPLGLRRLERNPVLAGK
jgi:hypothetical protein